MKIAVASSGLGHVARGIETWARDTAEALVARGVDVTLFSAARPRNWKLETGNSIVVLNSLKRSDLPAKWLVKVTPPPFWRWGLKTTYGWEQLSFWRKLRPRLIEGDYDILHVQDPMVAFWCRRDRQRGVVKTREILAHGTEESPEFLAQFDYVQHLAPWHLEQVEESLSGQGPTPNAQRPTPNNEEPRTKDKEQRKHWFALPNFVDTERFRPPENAEEKARCRKRFGIPKEAFVVGASSALKKTHKRVDWLIREFSTLLQNTPILRHSDTPILLLAGASQIETPEIEKLAGEQLRESCLILKDLPGDAMPDYYRALDVFVHGSLFEMMPIAFLEAMASGLPMISHDHPVMQWMIGARNTELGTGNGQSTKRETGRIETKNDLSRRIEKKAEEQRTRNGAPPCGGACIDMSKEGELAAFLPQMTPKWIGKHGRQAQQRAVTMFSKKAVIAEYIKMYEVVMDVEDG